MPSTVFRVKERQETSAKWGGHGWRRDAAPLAHAPVLLGHDRRDCFAAGIAQAWAAGFPRDQSLLGVALNSAGHVFHLATGLLALIFGVAKIRPALP